MISKGNYILGRGYCKENRSCEREEGSAKLHYGSRKLQRKWVSHSENAYGKELYFGSCILQGTKGNF